ncbi:MAG: efflux RND transporter periplasmic adaptor subunit [Rhizobiales bacterium]|nr:efflux RND transporter periplasmic adaptor subunit [Hyphomicrobiales bacterium]
MPWLAVRPLAHTPKSVLAAVVLILCILLAVAATTVARRADKVAEADISGQSRRVGELYYPTPKQWASLITEPVTAVNFRTEHLTEGKIAVDEDRATLVFSPYAGRVIKLLAKPGDVVIAGQSLFEVEAPDMVQAQNDFIGAMAGLNKARSQLDLAGIVENQNKSLYETRAVPLRDLQQAQAAKLAAQNDLRSAETSLEVARNRLRILGKTDAEIKTFSETGTINPLTTIYSPIAGTVVQRRVGPGQYINTSSNSAAANDATFVIGDLSTVWLVAYVRESEAPNVHVGAALHFTVLAFPDRVFTANIAYVATSLDAATRRLLVRATLNNSEGMLKPEMFASVTILTGEGDTSPAVPREAVIYDGQTAHVWVAREDRSVEPRKIKTGLNNGPMVQVLDGLKLGEKVVTKGSLFVDRAAAAS